MFYILVSGAPYFPVFFPDLPSLSLSVTGALECLLAQASLLHLCLSEKFT